MSIDQAIKDLAELANIAVDDRMDVSGSVVTELADSILVTLKCLHSETHKEQPAVANFTQLTDRGDKVWWNKESKSLSYKATDWEPIARYVPLYVKIEEPVEQGIES